MEKKYINKRYRSFIGTLHYPGITDVICYQMIMPKYIEAGAKYICGQLEKGKETEKLHFQFFVYFPV